MQPTPGRDEERYRFGSFVLEVTGRELRRGEALVPLPGKAFDLLLTLVRGAGQVVTKSQLMAALWADTVVEESNLTQTVFVLRKALGEDTGQTGFIRTVPRRGYEFIGNVNRETVDGKSFESLPIPQSHVPRFWPALTVLLMVGLGAVGFILFRKPPADARVVRSAILPPENTSRYSDGWLALSPDGRRIAFAMTGADGKKQVWIRQLELQAAQPLEGTEGAQKPFWSPDNRWLAFFANGKLKKIDTQGGPPVTLADAPVPRGGSWSAKSVILFSPAYDALQQVSAAGGKATPATVAALGGEQCWPWFLPDGEHYLFAAKPHAGGDSRVTLRVGSLRSTATKIVAEAANAIYSQGRLLYLKEGTLVAQPFDVTDLRTTGEPEAVVEAVGHYRDAFQAGFFSASSTGMLAYLAAPRVFGRQLTWFDRAGKALGTVGEPRAFYDVEFSPDRNVLEASVADAGNVDLWKYDLARGMPMRFTFDPAGEFRAVWSSDGRSIVFNSNRNGHGDIYRKAASGAGAEVLLYADSKEKYPVSWSRDGKALLYIEGGGSQVVDLSLLLLESERAGAGPKHKPFLKSSSFGQFSPDGKWVAYESDESQPAEVYVVPFSQPSEKHQISPNGGVRPRWRQDGREIFYLTPNGQLTAAEVKISGDTVEVGAVRGLFGGIELGAGYFYDVSSDGQRILAAVPANRQNSPSPIMLVQNWTSTLKK